MAYSSYAANKCSNCSCKFSDGIIRNSKFYCDTACYDASKVRFSTGIRPSSLPPVVIKKCNYCFETFEKHACPGIDYGRLWFCSNYHLQLANPRPVMGPGMGHMGPGMGHMGPGMGHIIRPSAGPFFGLFNSFF